MADYKIKLDRKVLKLLGSQLYGDTPSVIAELVANSYDADAGNVWISLDTEKNSIIVEDDGIGMTVEDINNSFLNIGYNKREGQVKTNMGRLIMGRKGIGKLAVFSLTNNIKVLSVKNNKKCGCAIDFKKITQESSKGTDTSEPTEISSNVIKFIKNRTSINGSGTRIELYNISKKIGYSYRFIVSKLIRMFDVNDNDFKIHIRKNDEIYKALTRSELDYFSIMDTIIIIGEEHKEKLEKINNNSILKKYKVLKNFNDFLMERPRSKLEPMPYNITVEDINGENITTSFTLNGWMGTVDTLPSLRKLEEKFVGVDGLDEDIITINDNRISLYSRGKLGEYDILSKIKSNSNYEAYVIGELFVDVFEDEKLKDMAISNRRGYEESDTRYTETIKIAKKLLGYIISKKAEVLKLKKQDDEQAEAKKIEEKFINETETGRILKEKLNEQDREIIQSENLQFVRATQLSRSTKKIFISHKVSHQLYGRFIISVLEDYGVNAEESVIFSSDPRFGVPQGKDIFNYLKECFRKDLMVVFIFSKSFYDSNVCLGEVGAAWATNQNCLNVIIDIDFGDVEKPSDNALSGIKFKNLQDTDQIFRLIDFFDVMISKGLGIIVDKDKLELSIKKTLTLPQYNSKAIDNPEIFYPTRKYTPQVQCNKCKNTMKLMIENEKVFYECINVGCKNKLSTLI
ncbi:hypothetical protein GH810_05715 [Acetobacterium paludosum]|uniref:TIR domain-containing protein n=1 Tax=Acetobacterium paludosum TaxID=52693 RepID=A0A923HV89_9FIRM|nr:ATP-binding protein [Acetobacterium paludosum]MBC3887802.1 hypothetical protein [Acetobacterium paludosum]